MYIPGAGSGVRAPSSAPAISTRPSLATDRSGSGRRPSPSEVPRCVVKSVSRARERDGTVEENDGSGSVGGLVVCSRRHRSSARSFHLREKPEPRPSRRQSTLGAWKNWRPLTLASRRRGGRQTRARGKKSEKGRTGGRRARRRDSVASPMTPGLNHSPIPVSTPTSPPRAILPRGRSDQGGGGVTDHLSLLSADVLADAARRRTPFARAFRRRLTRERESRAGSGADKNRPDCIAAARDSPEDRRPPARSGVASRERNRRVSDA